MDCNVIEDLIPLYVDGCCSEESARLVQSHIADCDACKKLYESMKLPAPVTEIPNVPGTMRRISDWKASVMQTLLLVLSFGLITVGVAMEARTPVGVTNGWWAMGLVIPATGFMLSLANWYFVRLYQSRRQFSVCSFLATLGVTAAAYVWSVLHYEIDLSQLLGGKTELAPQALLLSCMGLVLSGMFCVLSRLLSNTYARMLGKD